MTSTVTTDGLGIHWGFLGATKADVEPVNAKRMDGRTMLRKNDMTRKSGRRILDCLQNCQIQEKKRACSAKRKASKGPKTMNEKKDHFEVKARMYTRPTSTSYFQRSRFVNASLRAPAGPAKGLNICEALEQLSQLPLKESELSTEQ
jgi:hypothetical protein